MSARVNHPVTPVLATAAHSPAAVLDGPAAALDAHPPAVALDDPAAPTALAAAANGSGK